MLSSICKACCSEKVRFIKEQLSLIKEQEGNWFIKV